MSEYRSSRVPHENVVSHEGGAPDLAARSATYRALQCVVDCTQTRIAGERTVYPVHFAEQLADGGHAPDIGLLWVGIDGWTYSDDVHPQAACPKHSHETHPWLEAFLLVAITSGTHEQIVDRMIAFTDESKPHDR